MAFSVIFFWLLCTKLFGVVYGASDIERDNAQQATPLENRSTSHSTTLNVSTSQQRETLGQSVARRADDGLATWEVVVAQLTQRLDQVTAELQALRNSVSSIPTVGTAAVGSGPSTFVHWGRASCPATSILAYQGVVGGSAHNEPGGAVNFLCLPMDPQFGNLTVPAAHADLFGSQYQTADTVSNNADPLCAVCLSPSTTVMIPARAACPNGWKLEYHGYLMSGKSSHPAASEFICVDAAFEQRPGSILNQEGKLLYYTLAYCGSLPCPPYLERKVITCAVCSF